MRDKATATVEAIERAIKILDAFSADQPELGVADLARQLGLKRSTVHRALVTLESGGILHQDQISQKYSLGAKILWFAHLLQSHLSLDVVALPAMKALRDQCNETVALHLLERGGRVCIRQVESRQELRRTYQNLGEPIPLHAGSPGKVMMAYLADEEIESYIDSSGLKAFTPDSITDRERFLLELRKTRECGYAVSIGERTLGINSIACPVRNASGRVFAAINISGPQSRLSDVRLLEYLPMLMETTLSISRRLGYVGPAIP